MKINILSRIKDLQHSKTSSLSSTLHFVVRFSALMLLCALLCRAVQSASMPTVIVGSPTSGEIEQLKTLSGSISPQISIPVNVPDGITVENVSVQVGQSVQNGDVLLTLSTDELQERIDTLETQIAQLNAQKEQLESQLDYAPTNPVTDAQLALQRAEEDRQFCIEDSDASQDALIAADRAVEDAEIALQRALDTYAEQQLQADKANKVSAAEAAVLQQQLDDLLVQQDNYQDLLNAQGNICAEMSGIVMGVTAIAGIPCDGTAITLGDTNGGWLLTLKIEAEIFNSYPNQNPEIEVVQGNVNGKGTLQNLSEADGQTILTILLSDGAWSTGDATSTLRFSSRHYDTCIPVSALHQDSSGWYIYLVNTTSTILGMENRLTPLPVTLLEKNDNTAAVEGVSLQSTIAVHSNKPLYAGDTVKVATS